MKISVIDDEGEESRATDDEPAFAPFYRGVPAGEVVRAIGEMPVTDLNVVLEIPN